MSVPNTTSLGQTAPTPRPPGDLSVTSWDRPPGSLGGKFSMVHVTLKPLLHRLCRTREEAGTGTGYRSSQQADDTTEQCLGENFFLPFAWLGRAPIPG